jgi:hypothetical protein
MVFPFPLGLEDSKLAIVGSCLLPRLPLRAPPSKTLLASERFLRTPRQTLSTEGTRVLGDSFRFVLPDGRSACVAASSARLICDGLWDLGIAPGAATAAAKISDALHSPSALRDELAFTEREVVPLLEAAKCFPPTWSSLVGRGADAGISPEQRQILLATCDRLCERLRSEGHASKLRSLLADLERLAARLRTGD